MESWKPGPKGEEEKIGETEGNSKKDGAFRTNELTKMKKVERRG